MLRHPLRLRRIMQWLSLRRTSRLLRPHRLPVIQRSWWSRLRITRLLRLRIRSTDRRRPKAERLKQWPSHPRRSFFVERPRTAAFAAFAVFGGAERPFCPRSSKSMCQSVLRLPHSYARRGSNFRRGIVETQFVPEKIETNSKICRIAGF